MTLSRLQSRRDLSAVLGVLPRTTSLAESQSSSSRLAPNPASSVLRRSVPLPPPAQDGSAEALLRRSTKTAPSSSTRVLSVGSLLPRSSPRSSQSASGSARPAPASSTVASGPGCRTPARRVVSAVERRHREDLVREGSRLLDGGPSFLETRAIAHATRVDYRRRIDNFNKEAKIDAETCALDLLEMSLLEYFDTQFMLGEDIGHGLKLLAALGHFRPELRRLARTLALPRVKIALQGWQRVAPSVTRLPVPWPVLSALCVVLLRMELPEMALATLLAADAYLRPGELLWLMAEDVVVGKPTLGKVYGQTGLLLFPSERGRPSKTHLFNDSVMLDHPQRLWLGPLLEAHARKRRGLPLFSFTYRQWLESFRSAGHALGLEDWGMTLYVLRHIGPTADYLTRSRTLPDIQRRGRWGQESSVRRYEKASRVTSRLAKLTAPQLDFVEECDKHLEAFLMRRRPLPVLAPLLWTVAVDRRGKKRKR